MGMGMRDPEVEAVGVGDGGGGGGGELIPGGVDVWMLLARRGALIVPS